MQSGVCCKRHRGHVEGGRVIRKCSMHHFVDFGRLSIESGVAVSTVPVCFSILTTGILLCSFAENYIFSVKFVLLYAAW